jgi:molecular chaperone HscB
VANPDHFERLGLPRRFAVDAASLEAAYLARSRAVHPDRHGLASGAEQLASLELSAALNEAYATLRDPFRRAEYLLTLEGGPSAAELKDTAPTFLMEMLDLRERIEEARSAGGTALADLEDELARRREGVLAHVAQLFAVQAEAGDSQPRREQIRRELNAARYLNGLLRDVRAE